MTTDPDLAALSTVTSYLRQLLLSVEEEQWSRATPCDDWDLRALVDHVVGGNWFTLTVLSGATAEESLDRAREQFAGGSPSARQAAASASEQLEAFRADGALERTWHHVAGDLTGREVLRLRLHDLIVHAWDISQSIESAAELPGELVSWGLAELRSEASLTAQHFDIDAGRLGATDDSALSYLRLFDRVPHPEENLPR